MEGFATGIHVRHDAYQLAEAKRNIVRHCDTGILVEADRVPSSSGHIRLTNNIIAFNTQIFPGR